MQDIVVTTNENTIKISTIEKGEFSGISAQLTQDVVKDYQINNVEEYASVLRELISQITKKGHGSLALTFLMEPQDVVLKFISVSKSNDSLEDQLINEARAKVPEISLDESYFAFMKVAPFVYQFVGIKKETLDKYVEISNKLGIGLRSIFPWVSFLPKIVETNQSAIFISKMSDEQVVALSEFGGIFFSGVYEKDKNTKDLQKLVTDLSVYKRKNPISKIYVYKYEGFSLNPEYEIIDVAIPNNDNEASKGFELHLIANQLLAKDPTLYTSKLNLLSNLPFDVVKNKSSMMPFVLGGFAALLVLGGLVYFGSRAKDTDSQKQPQQEVIENVPIVEQPAEQPSEPKESAPEATVESELSKGDLKVFIQNGAGVAGVAGRTQSFMETAGYTVVDIGNANETGRTNTLVKIKATKNAYLPLIKEDMADKFTIISEEDLPEDTAYDALVIVGTDAQI